jgi:predicted ATP-dependent endonuclease of OLD family
MKIESVRIKNLRSFADETITFNDYTCLVGPNGSGKSTILCALNIFFREIENAATDLSQLDLEDFHLKNPDDPIEITVTFTDLNPQAQEDFANYFRHGKLVVSAIATFDKASGKAAVSQFGQRLGMSAFKEFFKAEGDGKRVAELKEIYNAIRQSVEIPAPGTKEAMTTALRNYESQHPDECELQLSEDQFYGITKGANRLANHVQWVYVPAVKDAASEQLEARNTALGKLLARTVRAKTNFEESVKALRTEMQTQYGALLEENQHVLEDLSKSLKARLMEWAHPEATIKLEWRQDDRSVRVEEPLARIIAGEGIFEGELARFGHGLQRSYLLALLQELASVNDDASPRLILGIEEPELYQHPPQARHLATLLQKLSDGNSQIIVSTHSPIFVSGEGFENVRMVRKNVVEKRSTVSHMSYEDIAAAIAAATGEAVKKPEGVLAKIHQALQPALNEMFFSTRLILVEGLEDFGYLSACLHLMGKWEEYRRGGCHIVPVNGKSELIQPLVIAKRMGIPTYVVFDSDADKPDHNGSRVKHEKDNKTLLTLLGNAGASPMPQDSMWGTGFVMWHSDIGSTVKGEIGEADWATYSAEADKKYGHAGGLQKNVLHIAAVLEQAWKNNKHSPCLERVCTEILDPTKCVNVQTIRLKTPEELREVHILAKEVLKPEPKVPGR